MLNRHPEILCDGESEFFSRDYGTSGESQLGRPLDDPDLLERYERVRGHGVALERRHPRALGPEGELPVLCDGVEDRRGHGTAAHTGGADEEDLFHAYFSCPRGA
jgi:hypothetical protein